MVKGHGRNHGNKVKLHTQFCKCRSWERIENYDKNKNGCEPSMFRVTRWEKKKGRVNVREL